MSRGQCLFVREYHVADGDLAVTFACSLLGSSATLALIMTAVAERLKGEHDVDLVFSLSL